MSNTCKSWSLTRSNLKIQIEPNCKFVLALVIYFIFFCQYHLESTLYISIDSFKFSCHITGIFPLHENVTWHNFFLKWCNFCFKPVLTFLFFLNVLFICYKNIILLVSRLSRLLLRVSLRTEQWENWGIAQVLIVTTNSCYLLGYSLC